jgi:hypothetical protein
MLPVTCTFQTVINKSNHGNDVQFCIWKRHASYLIKAVAKKDLKNDLTLRIPLFPAMQIVNYRSIFMLF